MRRNTTLMTLICALSAGVPVAATAHQAGDFIVRTGLAVVDPQDSSRPVNIESPALGSVAGATVGVDTDTQIGLSFTYMLHPMLGVEVLAATPFNHDINATGALAGAGKLGETKHLPPTVSAQFYPLGGTSSAIQPYIGLGLNYTLFFEEKTTPTLTGAIGALADMQGVSGVTATATKLELDDSIGLAGQLGADIKITDRMGFNAAVWWVDIDTTGTITADTNVGTVTSKVDVEIDPYVYMIGAYVKF